MLRRAAQTTLRAAGLRFRSFSAAASSRPPDHRSLRLWDKMSIKEGKSWVAMVPQNVFQHPRIRSRNLRWAGNARAAHKVLVEAGAHRSCDEADLIEFLLVLLNTDEFKDPRERLEAMVHVLWNSPTAKPNAAFNILLTACAREAGRVCDNSSAKRDVILKTAETVWTDMLQSVKSPDPRNTALMYRVCGECRDVEMAKKVRQQVNDPVLLPTEVGARRSVSANRANRSSEDATAAYILCLGNCGRPSEAEQFYFSGQNSEYRSSDKVLSALFQAYTASHRISKAESLIAMYGSGFLTVQCCNAFIKQCAALRLHDSALEFLGRMSRSTETGFPEPNARTYNLLLRGLSAGTGTEDRDVAAERALVVVEQMKAQGIEPTTVTYNTLIRSLVFRDQLKEALELYRGMESPNRITFSHLMQGAANVPDYDLAQEIFASLKEAKDRPNYGFCKSYLEVIVKLKGTDAAFSEALRISEEFGEVLVFGDVGSHEAIRMALISACGTVGDLQRAFDALHLTFASHSNTIGDLAPLYVATVLMQVCLECDAPGRALEVFYSLKAAGLRPNFEVYESLIQGLSAYARTSGMEQGFREHTESGYGVGEWYNGDNGHDSDASISSGSNGLRYEESGQRGNAQTSPALRPSEAVQRNGVSVEGPGPRKALHIAVQLLREMHMCGEGRAIRQAAYVYNTMIAAAAAVEDFELALQIFNKMSRRNNPGVVYFSRDSLGTSCDDKNIRIQLAGNGEADNANADGDVEEATGGDRARLAALASTGMFDSEFEFPAATVGTYNSMIDAAWKCGEPWFSFEVFDMMQMDRITEPNAATLSLLADIALSESKDVGVEAQRKLLKELDCVQILSQDVCKKRVRLRQKLVALRWS